MIVPQINFAAVAVSGIASMAIGFLWYSPLLFGKTWMKLTGMTEKTMAQTKSKMGVTYGISFVASLVMAYVLAHFIDLVSATTVAEGIQVGILAWLGFVATTMITTVLFDNKPWKLYAINCGYQLASVLVMATILVNWA